MKGILFFLFLLQNIDCGYSLELPRRGDSNVYPQSMFLAKKKKKKKKYLKISTEKFIFFFFFIYFFFFFFFNLKNLCTLHRHVFVMDIASKK